MPYFGLIDQAGCEITHQPSYHRVDWSAITWGINNRDPKRDSADIDYVLVNIDYVRWVAKEHWGKVWLAAFRELEDTTPFGGQGPGPFAVAAGDTLVQAPGTMRMPIWGCRWGGGDKDPDPKPPDEPVMRRGWWRDLVKS